MWYKIINKIDLEEQPKTYILPDGTVIENFDEREDLLPLYGYIKYSGLCTTQRLKAVRGKIIEKSMSEYLTCNNYSGKRIEVFGIEGNAYYTDYNGVYLEYQEEQQNTNETDTPIIKIYKNDLNDTYLYLYISNLNKNACGLRLSKTFITEDNLFISPGSLMYIADISFKDKTDIDDSFNDGEWKFGGLATDFETSSDVYETFKNFSIVIREDNQNVVQSQL